MKSIEQDFLQLIDLHQKIIHKVCHIYTHDREDYDDLFQEIMLQLWKGYPNFKGNAKITTWMYRVSLYTAISIFKKKKNRKEVREQPAQEPGESTDHYEFENLNMAISQLSDPEKALIVLYLEEKSYQEIAEIIELSVTNVGVKLNRIKKKLKDILNTL
ncbi:sigma-70 family RNA polymerase sigma factor [Fulvivirga maritima]|uniref:RNA polymerase sigma factor n=1 Tax=Fulvivirga maritima TaxID=2904247 RepID=UPI001F19AF26|nr:sigma-70 family RNA polymerase sigma factor [Fulvivirga maritima]UII26482.1 sigma-70 family RNA polymerase sigma factor [Fulvivirga maritima]